MGWLRRTGSLTSLLFLQGLAVSSFALAEGDVPEDLFDLSLSQLVNLPFESATKVSRSAAEVPAQVTLITREQISDYGYSTLLDLLRNIPSLYIEQDTEEVFIGTRGSISGGILFLINGVAQHPHLQKGLTTVEANRLAIPITAIDRVEFIRGPMSVIYGNNAFQGTLNIVTDAEGPQRARLALGSDEFGETFLRLSRALTGGYFSLNLGGLQRGGFEGDYRDMLGPTQFDGLVVDSQQTMDGHMKREQHYLDASLNWQGLTLGVLYQRSDYPIYPTTPPLIDNDLELATWQVSLDYDVNFAEHWRSSSLLMFSDDSYRIDELGFSTPQLTGFQYQKSQRLEFEQNIVYRPESGYSVLLGYRFSEIEDVVNDSEVSIGSIYILDTERQMDVSRYHDLFAEWQQQLPSDVSLILGFRYSRLPDYYKATVYADKAAGPPVVDVYKTEDRSLINYRVAAIYPISQTQQLKLLHGTASQDVELLQFTEPKTIRTTEVVHSFRAPTWSVSQSLYYNRIQKIARRTLSFENNVFVDSSVNNGRWHTAGYEIMADYRPLPYWRISASFSVQNTEDHNSELGIGYSPEKLFKLKTDYRINRHTLAFYAHFVDARDSDWRFEDMDNNGNADSAVRLGKTAGAYWMLNSNWRYEWTPEISASLNISNLLDRRYRYPANEISDLDRGLIGVGRTVVASIDIEF